MTDNQNIEHLLGRIHNTDCLEFMKQLPDKCVDLVLTDPPYQAHFENGGGSFGNRAYFGNIKNGVGSNLEFTVAKILPEIKRLCKSPFCGYFWTSQRLIFEYIMFAKENGFHYDIIVWNKLNPLPTKNNKYLPDLEYCVFIRESGAYFNNDLEFNDYRKCITTLVNKSQFGHPTEKPISVINPSIKVSSKIGSIVFDPFMGSGTTAVAAERLGRRWFGCELSEAYCAIAQKRIDAERMQLKLF